MPEAVPPAPALHARGSTHPEHSCDLPAPVFFTALRSARRGAPRGPFGMTKEHGRLLYVSFRWGGG